MSKPLTFLALSAALLSAAHAAPQAIASCSADKITTAMASCDSVVNISRIKCDTTACHKALHLLVDPDYVACYEELKMGSKSDLDKYKALDDFCHGEGPDPLEANANGNGTTAGGGATAEKNESVPAKASTVPSPSPTPSSGAATIACSAAVTLAIVVAALV
jgi:hypothetical protein